MGRYDALSREQAIALLERRDRERRYGLVWERDEIEADQAINHDFVALDIVPELCLGEPPWDDIIIEGDNWDALRALGITHAGRIKCTYIDPPYNTGNKDWVYNDSFVNPENRFFHSTWIEFLYPRLLMSRNIFASASVFLASMSDENRSALDLLIQQTLVPKDRASIVWRSRQGSNADQSIFLSQNHEHILVAAFGDFQFSGFQKSFAMYKRIDENTGEQYRLDNMTLGFGRDQRPNLYFPIKDPDTDIWYPCNPSAVWRFASRSIITDQDRLATRTMEEWIEQDRIAFPQNDRCKVWRDRGEILHDIQVGDVPKSGNTLLINENLPDLDFWIGKKVGFGRPSFKRYKSDLRRERQPLSSWVVPRNENSGNKTAVTSIVSGTNEEGSAVVRELFGYRAFNYPKPLSLIRELVRQSTAPGDITLDFFAGSGTTAHAVMALNAEDGGDRRFIMVSNTEATADAPDKNLCRDVLRERVRRAADKLGLEPRVAYLRAARVKMADLDWEDGLTDQRAWTLLRMMHGLPVAPLDMADGVAAATLPEGGAIAYLDQLSEAGAARLAALATDGPVIAYAWAPGQVRVRFEDDPRVEPRPVVDSLLARFRP